MAEKEKDLKQQIQEMIAKAVMKEDQEKQNPAVDYAEEYKRQTGKDLETGKFAAQ